MNGLPESPTPTVRESVARAVNRQRREQDRGSLHLALASPPPFPRLRIDLVDVDRIAARHYEEGRAEGEREGRANGLERGTNQERRLIGERVAAAAAEVATCLSSTTDALTSALGGPDRRTKGQVLDEVRLAIERTRDVADVLWELADISVFDA